MAAEATESLLKNVPERLDLKESQNKESKHGLSVWTAGVFIVGEIAGSGVLALPNAVEGTGIIGIPLICLCGLVSVYTASVLGTCWCLVRERHAEYRTGHVRYPYPAMGQMTYGKPFRLLISFAINFSSYGTCVVYLILASQNLHDLFRDLQVNISFCYWILVVGGVVTFFTWLGTPKDFWPIAVGAAVSTGIACVIVSVNMLMDKAHRPEVRHSPPDVTSFSAAFGTMAFAFGGHQIFPTFQIDMKDHTKFSQSVLFGYAIVIVMYLPVSTIGYLTYGRDTQANLLLSISTGPLLTTVEILVTLHLLCGVVILLNPLCQESEEIFKVPHRFCLKRCIVRTVLMCLVIFGAESVPKFGNILSLIGGSTLSSLAFIFPPLIYLKLAKMKGPWPKMEVPLHKTVLLYEILIVGAVAGVASTYSTIASLTSADSFTVPCYVNMTAAAAVDT